MIKDKNGLDIVIHILIIIILASIYFLWMPLFPYLAYFNTDLLIWFRIIKTAFPIVTIMFVLYLQNYYDPIVIVIPDNLNDFYELYPQQNN